MTKSFVRTALAAFAAVTLLPVIASAQTPDRQDRKPAAQERQVKPPAPRAGKPSEAKRGHHLHRNQLADRRFDRHDDRRGDRAGPHQHRDGDKRYGRDGRDDRGDRRG